MQPYSKWRLLYAVLLILLSVGTFTAVAKNKIPSLLNRITSSVEKPEAVVVSKKEVVSFKNNTINLAAEAPVFTTIIQGADEEVGCSNNGFTIARFNLCGDSDDRNVSLSGGPYGSVEWQILGGSCTPDINEDCPNTTTSCYTTVSTNQTFNLDASSIPAGSGAEFRVIADGAQYFFKVKKSTITQTFEKRDFICGVEGRIQITNLSSSYEYSINDGNSWQPSPIFNGLGPGTYNLLARLQNTPNTCEYPYEPIVIEQLDISMDVEFVDAQCFGDNGSITVTVNDVPGPYRYTLLDENGVPQEFTTFINANPYTFSAVGFGTYSVQVETQQCAGDPGNGVPPPRQDVDVNGNPIIIGDGVIALSASTEVNESLSTEPSCNPPGGVDIILRTSGGTAPYSYTVNGITAGSFSPPETIYNVSSAGSYDFIITDANGCTITASADVQELTPPDVTASGIDGTCTNGGARLEFNVVDGKGYNLSFRATSTEVWSASPSISVAAGTYGGSNPDGPIEVLYEQGSFSCILQLSADVTVDETGAINGADPTFVDRTCDGSGGVNNGSITFPGTYSGAGGGPYEFSINGSDFFSAQVFNNLPAGTYNPAVRNGSGCRKDFTAIIIADVDPPTDITFVQSNTNCTTNTSDVQLTETATNTITTYEIIAPVSATDSNNTGLFSGLDNNVSHVFRITDANGCTYQESFTPTLISSIRVRLKSGGDLRVCPSATDGEATFLVDGFANTYSYTVNPGGFSGSGESGLEIDLTGVGANTYTITVTDDDTGCTTTEDVTISEPTNILALSANVTSMSCANNNIGRVEAVASDGFGGYRYELDWPATSSVGTQGPKTGRFFGNLTEEGTYTLRVIDSEGCTAEATFTLTEVDPPSIALGPVDYCFGPSDDASIEVSSTAGSAAIGTHEYRINGGALQASPIFNGLTPGNYTIEVVDGNNCTDDIQVTIPPQIQINLSLNTEIPCGGDGEMGITVNGGDISNLASTSYTIFLDGTAVTTPTQLPSNSFTYTVPLGSDGNYTVEVTDNNGCTNTSAALSFSPPATITATADPVGPSCGDDTSGYIEIIPDVSLGSPPFEVILAPVGTGLVDSPLDSAQPAGYSYSPQTIYSGLSAGDYEYIVKDARGCTTGVLNVTLADDPTNPPDATVTPIAASCSANVVSGGIEITSITDGRPDFIVIIEDNFGNEIFRQDGVTSADLPLSITDLPEGNYMVITLDSRGCLDQDPVSVTSTTVDIVPTTTLPTVCDANGFTYCVEIVGGTGPFEIRTVEDPAIPFTPLGGTPGSPVRNHCFSNIQFGESFTVEVLDTATGCTYEELIEIPDGPSTVEVDLTVGDATCTGDLVTIDWAITGTTGTTINIEIQNLDTGEIVLTDASSANTTGGTLNVPEGPYAITVIDDGSGGTGCSDGDTGDAVLNYPRVDVINNQNANCNELGQLTYRGSGGTPFGPGILPNDSPYEYAVVPAGSTPVTSDYNTETTVALAGSLAGIAYDIWVRDARGCEFRTSATVVRLDADLPIPDIIVNNQCDGVIPAGGYDITLTMPAFVDNPTFTLAGQTQTPTYDPAVPTVATFNVGNSPGVFDVMVVDANGCDVRKLLPKCFKYLRLQLNSQRNLVVIMQMVL